LKSFFAHLQGFVCLIEPVDATDSLEMIVSRESYLLSLSATFSGQTRRGEKAGRPHQSQAEMTALSESFDEACRLTRKTENADSWFAQANQAAAETVARVEARRNRHSTRLFPQDSCAYWCHSIVFDRV
jgi:hypothetical protein